MRTVCLGDLVRIIGGGTPDRSVSEYWGEDIPWVTVKDFKDIEISSAQESITELGLQSSASNLIKAGSILVPTRMALGKAAVNTVDVAINQDLKAIQILDSSLLDQRYLLRFLLSKSSYFESRGKGATVKGITLDVLRELPVPLPSLEEQKRIAAILDKADSLRRKRAQAIALADDFLSASFLKNYADSAARHQPFKMLELAEPVKNSFVNGPFGSDLLTSELTDSGVPVVYIRDIRNGVYDRVSTVCVTKEKADNLAFCNVIPNDVLIAKVGDPPGTAAMYPSDGVPAIVTQDVIRIRCNLKVCHPEYLTALINSLHGQILLRPIVVEATRSRIGLGDLKKLNVLIPPVDDQIKFVLVQRKVRGVLSLLDGALRKSDQINLALNSNLCR